MKFRTRKSLFGINKRFSYIFFTLIACLILILLAAVMDRIVGMPPKLINIDLLNKFLELFLLIISSSIFLVLYFTYPQTNNNQLLIVSCVFLAGGLLYLIKILDVASYHNVDTNTNQSCNTFFLCILIRFINSVCFSTIATLKIRNITKIKRYKLLAITIVVLVFFLLLLMKPSINSMFSTEDGGMSNLSIAITILNCLLHAYTFYRILYLYREKNDLVNKTLSCGFLIMFFSELTLLNIRQVYDMQTIVSQLFLGVSYSLLFYSFCIHSIRRPYLLLSKANKKRDSYLVKMDKLVDIRTKELQDMYEKLMADQEIARGIQISMLPKELPADDSVSFSAGFLPAGELSGDFYNVFRIDEARYGIYIGDVSGHGVSAAMLSIFAFQKMQSLMEEIDGDGMVIPSRVLQNLYESFNSSNFNDDMYFVMLYGVFNTQTGIFSYASGGLNTIPLRIRPDGSFQELDSDGFAICKLGDFLNPKFVNYQILLFPGDKLVLYTDGLIDAKNPKNEEYSLARLKASITDYEKYGSEYLTNAIIRDVSGFAGEKPSDDITLLIMDLMPPF